jgi:MFS family permease
VGSLGRNREYVALWVGQAVSNLGISISSFAYPVVVLAATGSPVEAGAVGSVLAATAFFLRLPAGVLVDRWNRRTILIACDLGRAVNALAFGLVLAAGHFYYPQVLLVAFVEAALGVLFGPAESAAVRRVVRPEQVREAVAANQSRGAVPGVIGPPLGGVLLTAGRAAPFLADAVSYLVSLACVASVRSELQERRSDAPRRRPAEELFDGLRWIWAHRFLRTFLLLFTGFGLAFSSIGLIVLVLARDGGASPTQIGLMFGITSAGGVLGALAAPRLVRRLSPLACIVAFAWIATAAIFSLAFVHSPYAYGAAGAIAFFFAPSLNAIAFGIVAEDAPDALQGRVTSAAIQIASLAGPIAPLAAGVLIDRVGAKQLALGYGCLLAVLACIASLAGSLRAERRPDDPRGQGRSRHVRCQTWHRNGDGSPTGRRRDRV